MSEQNSRHNKGIVQGDNPLSRSLASYATQSAGGFAEQDTNPKSNEMHEDSFDRMWSDPAVQTISFRRHAKYERDPNSGMRGEIELGHLPELRTITLAWAEKVPEQSVVTILASPSAMPARAPDGGEKFNSRARTTAMFYGQALRNKFGRDFTFHNNPDQVREINSKKTSNPDPIYKSETDQKNYIVEREIGDILEFVDWDAGQSVAPFFKELSSTYGGLTPHFWRDYITGQLPESLEKIFLENGGQTALEKTDQAIDLLFKQAEEKTADSKSISLLISHEEVIGSIVYQIAQYLRGVPQATKPDDIEGLESASFGYNQGFDMHVSDDGKALVKVDDVFIDIDLRDFSHYLKSKIGKNQ